MLLLSQYFFIDKFSSKSIQNLRFSPFADRLIIYGTRDQAFTEIVEYFGNITKNITKGATFSFLHAINKIKNYYFVSIV